MRRNAPISSIYRMGEPTPDPNPERVFARLFRLSCDLWTSCGTIVARPDELPEDIRIPLTQWADENYGRRKTKHRRKAG